MFCDQTIFDRFVTTPREANHWTRSRGRFMWGMAALGLFAGTILQVQNHGGGWLALGFALMPDLGLIAGIDRHLEQGQLSPRGVPLYNALHRFIGPVMLAILALAGLLPAVGLSAALGWALHISIDRTIGYGLRGADGFKRP